MTRGEIHLRAIGVLPSVRVLAAAVRAVLAEWRVGEERAALLEVAVVEAATNVVRHAYQGIAPGPVEISLFREGSALTVEVADCGHPFDPASVPPPPEPDPTDPSTWPEGGMGLPLIRSACDELSYESASGRNRLVLRLSAAELEVS